MNYSFEDWVKITHHLSEWYSQGEESPVVVSFYPFIDIDGNPKGYIIYKHRTDRVGVSMTSYTFDDLNRILETK